MENDAELNQMLLNAMFALNEAGDNLDEIYRIGLETAVSLLNADRGCIFERDDWDDNKWTIIKSFQFDSQIAETVTAAQLLSPAADEVDFPFTSKLFALYQEHGIATPEKIYYFPLKMFKWTRWILHIEVDSQSQLSEERQKAANQFYNQFETSLQKINQFNKINDVLPAVLHDTRAPNSNVIACMELLLMENDDTLSDQQKVIVDLAQNAAKRIQNTILSATYYSRPFNRNHSIDLHELVKEIYQFSPQTTIQLPTNKFVLFANELFLAHLFKAILKTSTQSQITLDKNSTKLYLMLTCFYEDLNLQGDIHSNQKWHYSPFLEPDNAPLFLMKSFVNYNGGQFKISAEAGKGYTLTITFPIVTEDANE